MRGHITKKTKNKNYARYGTCPKHSDLSGQQLHICQATSKRYDQRLSAYLDTDSERPFTIGPSNFTKGAVKMALVFTNGSSVMGLDVDDYRAESVVRVVDRHASAARPRS